MTHSTTAKTNECEEVLDQNTNLLELGADAWSDTELIEAFDRDLELFKKYHPNQLKNLSSVPKTVHLMGVSKFAKLSYSTFAYKSSFL